MASTTAGAIRSVGHKHCLQRRGSTFKKNNSLCSCGVKGAALKFTNEDLTSAQTRLSTFKTWPEKSPVTPLCLSKAGLYYIGKKDHVKCAYCHVTLGEWCEGDSAAKEHARFSPNCSFLQNLQMGHSNKYVSHKSRLVTFEGHEHDFGDGKPYYYSDAGFYYTGTSDHAKCFSCGVLIGEWEPNDDPWKQHAPECEYVKEIRGDEFAQKLRVMKTVPNTPSSSCTPPENDTPDVIQQ